MIYRRFKKCHGLFWILNGFASNDEKILNEINYKNYKKNKKKIFRNDEHKVDDEKKIELNRKNPIKKGLTKKGKKLTTPNFHAHWRLCVSRPTEDYKQESKAVRTEGYSRDCNFPHPKV